MFHTGESPGRSQHRMITLVENKIRELSLTQKQGKLDTGFRCMKAFKNI